VFVLFLRIPALATAAFVSLLLSLVISVNPALAQGAFYSASPAELTGQPGSIIRQEEMVGAPLGAHAFRVLYQSTGLGGEAIPATFSQV
jgi:hypothetical protein